MARFSTLLDLPQGSIGHYKDINKGWDSARVTVTDLPDGTQLIEVAGALRDAIGGSGDGTLLGTLPTNLRPELNQVGSRAMVKSNGEVRAVGAFDTGNTISFKVSYTRG